MLTLSLCVHRKTLSHPAWKLERKKKIYIYILRGSSFYFFKINTKVTSDVLTQWEEERRTCVCVCVGVCTCSAVHMRRFVSVLRTPPCFCGLASTSGSAPQGNSEPQTDQNKSCFLIFPASVCIHYISR